MTDISACGGMIFFGVQIARSSHFRQRVYCLLLLPVMKHREHLNDPLYDGQSLSSLPLNSLYSFSRYIASLGKIHIQRKRDFTLLVAHIQRTVIKPNFCQNIME